MEEQNQFLDTMVWVKLFLQYSNRKVCEGSIGVLRPIFGGLEVLGDYTSYCNANGTP